MLVLAQSRSPADAQQLSATSHDWPTTFQLIWPSVVRSSLLSAVLPVTVGNVVLVIEETDGYDLVLTVPLLICGGRRFFVVIVLERRYGPRRICRAD